MTARLCLVRHGQTDWNREGRYAGQSDVPLNAAGRAQAGELAAKLKGEIFAAAYASDLGRTIETAEIIAAPHGLAVTVDARLREIHQGQWEGKHVSAIQSLFAELWEKRRHDPADFRPPGGETVAEVAERVAAALDEIARRHPGQSVLVVTHGLAMSAAICTARGLPVGQAYQVLPPNAEPVWVEWGE